ncbi:MAG: hypothetical protein ACOX5W_07305 [Bacillota bacterium]
MLVLVEIVSSLYMTDETSYWTEIEVEDGTVLAQLGERLGIPGEMAYMAIVNGSVQMGDYLLKENDLVVFYAIPDTSEEIIDQ